MKALTIEELKELPVGEWVWITRLNNNKMSGYVTDINFTAKMFTCKSVNRVATTARIADYGKTWLAYKNKEFAESKGKWVELLCSVGDTVYGVGMVSCAQKTAKTEAEKKRINNYCWERNGKCENCKYAVNGIIEYVCEQIQIVPDGAWIAGAKHEFFRAKNIYTDKSEAEARLKELHKE